ENYLFFLKKVAIYISPMADTFAYCLMPNHIHFFIKIKSESELELTFGKFETFQKLEARISKQFSNLLSSYTQSYNKVYKRKGSLFTPNFKRKEVDSDDYFTRIVFYIHANPVHHGFVKNPYDWKFSSIHSFNSESKTLLQRNEVVGWFGGLKQFIDFHQQPIDIKAVNLDEF
ncbi:MAG: hypothetical protein NTX03_05505, partial [Bacteroidetes bacterium]|nr:hypothetical protein [Bacteroidota bacterium]